MIYIASDHGGYKLKEHLKKYLIKQKHEYVDLGPDRYIEGDDYTEYAAEVADQVSRNPLRDVGILICRSGQGVCIVANKFKNIRAGLIWNTKEAKMSRNDDMTNVLCLPSDYIDEATAKRIVKTWLATPYSKASRHVRRVKQISKLEGK